MQIKIKYKISNFWTGKYFIKRLINKIFKYKLKKEIIWKNNFWDDIQVQLIKCRIAFKKKNEDDSLLSNYNPKRKVDILRYKSMIDNKIDLGCSLFISGKCLNLIGGDVSESDIYLLDGSRRLIASLLSNKLNICIWLIELKE